MGKAHGILRAAGFQRMKLGPTLERSAVALGKNEKAAQIVHPRVAPVDKVVSRCKPAGAPPSCLHSWGCLWMSLLLEVEDNH